MTREVVEVQAGHRPHSLVVVGARPTLHLPPSGVVVRPSSCLRPRALVVPEVVVEGRRGCP